MERQRYVALLRGINVGGHHKVPMADLRTTFEGMGFSQLKTLLNSGNIVFDGPNEQIGTLEAKISVELEKTFGFPIPVLVRKADEIREIIASDPFKDVQVTKDTRLYVTFYRAAPKQTLPLPWVSPDGSYQIMEVTDGHICSVLDVSKSMTPDAMDILEKNYSKDITTRNWNTVLKIEKQL